jgi:hypothetical protein
MLWSRVGLTVHQRPMSSQQMVSLHEVRYSLSINCVLNIPPSLPVTAFLTLGSCGPVYTMTSLTLTVERRGATPMQYFMQTVSTDLKQTQPQLISTDSNYSHTTEVIKVCQEMSMGDVRVGVLTTVIMKNTSYWYMTLYSLVETCRRFGRMCCLLVCFLGLLLYLEDGASTFLRNVGKFLPYYTASHLRIQYSSKFSVNTLAL